MCSYAISPIAQTGASTQWILSLYPAEDDLRITVSYLKKKPAEISVDIIGYDISFASSEVEMSLAVLSHIAHYLEFILRLGS